MNPLGSFTSMNEAYSEVIHKVHHCGSTFTPRGLKCSELRPACFTIINSHRGLYTGRTRRLNYYFFAVETLQYLAGWGDHPQHAELLISANSKMQPFLNENTGIFDGAYGPRLDQSFNRIEQQLIADPDTRQAVASIWRPEQGESKDVPCTVALHFYGDGLGLLDLTVYMRSNDLDWGTPYDVGAFCAIQCAMAGAVGMQPGRYNHIAGSLHLYYDHQPKVKAHDRPVDLQLPLNRGLSMRAIALRAEELLSALYIAHRTSVPRDRVQFGAWEIDAYCAQWIKLIRFKHEVDVQLELPL
jgi:hypothetical protein